MPHVRLQPGTWDLTYEITISPFGFSLLDAPGRLCDALLEKLAIYDASGEDLHLEDGDPGDRALICDLTDLNAAIVVRGDRVEIRYTDCTLQAPLLRELPVQIWEAMQAVLPGVRHTSHSVLIEMKAAIVGQHYQEFLNRFAPVPAGLPPGTRTAVVFYLPSDPKVNGEESSLVFNKTGNDEFPLQLNATLVYSQLDPANAVQAVWDRLGGLLGALGLGLPEEQ
ncbi:MAG TPA: hypothetical protein VGL72_24780 [Bryobacteraceae bacterium]|jgi:hypothetical protein